MSDVPTPPVNEQYERVLGSRLLALFGGAFLDQLVLDDVAAGVDWGGRFREEPFARARRTLSAQDRIVPGTEESRRRTGEWLQRAHRDVKGTYDGVRFSAFQPEAWNWIAMSGIRVFVFAYPVFTGKDFQNDREIDDFYRYVLSKFRYLELPSERNKLPRSWSEFDERYEEIIARRAKWTAALERESGRVANPPNPFKWLPNPLWSRISAPISRAVLTASFGIMHPVARDLSAIEWTSTNDRDFKRFRKVLPIVFRAIPRRFGSTALAYHAWKTRELTRRMENQQLESFLPGNSKRQDHSPGCPI
ncbi:oxygenase MpaB family protein [Gordonia malaquae]|uniref:oxygenase MpaB family protein n=1 Tax=Gordonia malaquae TaxID=410332 RepID=UPI0030FE2A60